MNRQTLTFTEKEELQALLKKHVKHIDHPDPKAFKRRTVFEYNGQQRNTYEAIANFINVNNLVQFRNERKVTVSTLANIFDTNEWSTVHVRKAPKATMAAKFAFTVPVSEASLEKLKHIATTHSTSVEVVVDTILKREPLARAIEKLQGLMTELIRLQNESLKLHSEQLQRHEASLKQQEAINTAVLNAIAGVSAPSLSNHGQQKLPLK